MTLLSRLSEGRDEEAWQQFVDLYAPLIQGYCRRAGLQEADSQDVAQTVFSKLSQYMGRFEYDSTRGRFRSWMGVVVTREIQRHSHKRARPGLGVGNGAHDELLNDIANRADPDWYDEFNACVLQRALSESRSAFDETTYLAFQRTWIEDVDSQQVAAELGRPVGWVYKAKFRVLRRLKVELKKLCMEEPSLL